MHDQAAQLRALVRATVGADPGLRPGPPLIVVSGAAKQAGASQIAHGLALELGRLGKRVVVVDANPMAPCQAELARVEASDAIGAVLSGARCIVEQLTRINEQVELLRGKPRGEQAERGREALERLLAELAGLGDRADLVVIDAGAGVTPWVELLWRHAQQVLLTCEAQPQSITAAYAAIKMAQSPALDGKVRLIISRCDEETAAAAAARFDDTCRRFLSLALKESAWIPVDWRDAVEAGQPLSKDQRYRRSLRLLAADVAADVRATTLRLIGRDRPVAALAASCDAPQADDDLPLPRDDFVPAKSEREASALASN